MSIKDGDRPAFPFASDICGHHGGMTLRDYFAAKAMQAYLGSYPNGGLTCRPDVIAADAYDVADAMLTERNKQ